MGGGSVRSCPTVPRREDMAEAAGHAGSPGPGVDPAGEGAELAAVIGATVPTGFELMAAEEVQEKLGSASRISRDRGKIYFEVPAQSLPQVRSLPLPGPRLVPGRFVPRSRLWRLAAAGPGPR